MDFKVILTPQAQDDLQEIVSFIARNNSSGARTFGNELIDQALTLASLPERGRVVPEIANADPDVALCNQTALEGAMMLDRMEG
jgi:plasmid stabilization system protein ParE